MEIGVMDVGWVMVARFGLTGKEQQRGNDTNNSIHAEDSLNGKSSAHARATGKGVRKQAAQYGFAQSLIRPAH